MNHLKLSGLFLAITICCAQLRAQTKVQLNEPDKSRPQLFGNLPQKLMVSVNDLNQLLSGNNETGKEVRLPLSDPKATGLSGKIISAAVKYQNTMRSVVVRLSDFKGATLTLSSSTHPDGTVTYSGRIISFQHADLYELEHKNDQYFLIKKNYYELVNE